jgi:hypothetical protein
MYIFIGIVLVYVCGWISYYDVFSSNYTYLRTFSDEEAINNINHAPLIRLWVSGYFELANSEIDERYPYIRIVFSPLNMIHYLINGRRG